MGTISNSELLIVVHRQMNFDGFVNAGPAFPSITFSNDDKCVLLFNVV